MKDRIITELEDILKMPEQDFDLHYRSAAFKQTKSTFGGKGFVTGILGLGNYCVNDCTYCGLRLESPVNRFRLDHEQLVKGVDYLDSLGIKRLLLISGEDPKRESSEIVRIIEYASDKGFYISLGAGVFSEDDIESFKAAGLNEFCLKFETSNRDIFKKVKPSTDYDARIKCLNTAVNLGLNVATGSIIGLAGQSLADIIADFKYTLTFNPSWIPIVPYLPAPGTPMAETTPPGDIDLTLRLISLFRLMLPETLITAGQPRKGSQLGFADPEGNAAAVKSGANSFFIDATPAAVREDFSIVGGRALAGWENLQKIFTDNGLAF